jgi:hypothetical protein
MKAVLVKLFATIFDLGANAPIIWIGGITIGQVFETPPPPMCTKYCLKS